MGEDLFRDYASKLFENTLLANDADFKSMTIGFCEAKMISPLAQAEIIRDRKVDQLFTIVSLYVNENKADRLGPALKIMEKCSTLQGTVKEMRKRYDPIPQIQNLNHPEEDTDGSSYKVFLSFKWEEGDALVKYLYDKLEEQKLDPWLDTQKMTAGDELPKEIEAGVKSCSLFVCVLTPGYFGSKWCKDEFKIADEGRRRFFPIQWKNDRSFKYPAEYEAKYRDILRYKYNPNAVNPEAEDARCASKIIEFINKQN